jgi:histidinol-phosphate phosphatase family protein
MKRMTRSPAVFLDKDGTLLEDVPYNTDPARMRFAPGTRHALRRLGALGVPLVVVSNQAGIARGRVAESAMAGMAQHLARMFSECGAAMAGFYYCPHDDAGPGHPACECRKPRPGMLLRAAREHGVELARSWMVGDILDDVEAGQRAGCSTILIDNGNETEWQRSPERNPHYSVADLDAAAQVITERMHGAQTESSQQAAPGRSAA